MVAIPVSPTSNTLIARYYCDPYGYCYNSAWYSWQRWVLLGVLLVIGFILLCCCACLSARRRRSRGLSPYYGTAWTAPPAYNVNNIPLSNNQPQYNGQTYGSSPYNGVPYQPTMSPPPPGYTPANAGYYQGHPQNRDYEMGNFSSGSAGPYIPPRPEEAHVSKH
ncbi:hypothetical protein AA313_de0208412 [Arthrobotrys entomopaga]|nr:hypothetical protein AA313_de0208412 [Arthrobotrys entomopaga]